MIQDVWGFTSISIKSIFVGWMITNWCNFRCSYCGQEHSRKGNEMYDYMGYKRYSHAFDNYSSEQWVEKILEIPYEKIALAITGGEPFLDWKNFRDLLAGLTQSNKIDNIRIDTNASWNVEDFRTKEINFNKIYLNISYHYDYWKLDKFIDRIKSFMNLGINIAMVNYVMSPEQQQYYEEVKNNLAIIGVKVNAAVFNDGHFPKSDEEIQVYKKYLNWFDLGYKAGLVSPKGKMCRYPMIGIYMRANGDISIGCEEKVIGNIFYTKFPDLMKKPLKCNKDLCLCLHMYSFLEECDRNLDSLNTLQKYSDEAIL